MRKTIANAVSYTGIGQYTGKYLTVTLKPAKAGSGIFVCRTDIGICNPIIKVGRESTFDAAHLNTTMSNGEVKLLMIEHLMSAVWALKITDLEIDVDGEEVPMFDGSANYWIRLLRSAGRVDIGEDDCVYNIPHEIKVENGFGSITARPCDHLCINFELEFEEKTIGKQVFTFDETKQNYFTEIAPARTFCTEKQVAGHIAIKKHFSNVDMVIFGDENIKTIDNYLRFPNEPVRHKILDVIGDLMTTGKFINGEFDCYKSGHALNRMMVDKIFELTK